MRTSTAYMNDSAARWDTARVHGAISSGGYHPVDVSRDAELSTNWRPWPGEPSGPRQPHLAEAVSLVRGVHSPACLRALMAGSTAGILNRPSPPRSLTATWDACQVPVPSRPGRRRSHLPTRKMTERKSTPHWPRSLRVGGERVGGAYQEGEPPRIAPMCPACRPPFRHNSGAVPCPNLCPEWDRRA